jgi:hypothetical protein
MRFRMHNTISTGRFPVLINLEWLHKNVSVAEPLEEKMRRLAWWLVAVVLVCAGSCDDAADSSQAGAGGEGGKEEQQEGLSPEHGAEEEHGHEHRYPDLYGTVEVPNGQINIWLISSLRCRGSEVRAPTVTSCLELL